VRDPGSTGLSEAVRRILMDPASGRLSVESETFLYMAARAQLVAEVIRPALDAGRVVVCERWTLSTEVYQGLAGGFGAGNVRRLSRLASRGTEPALTLVFDVAVGAGLARLARERDRMEQKDDAFHANVVRGYRRLAKRRAHCVLVTGGTVDEVAARVRAEVANVVG
jgi:dTMP kinase